MYMNEYKAMWQNYANFKDRTSVRGYWMAYLFNFLAALIISIIVGIIPQLAFLSAIYSLAVLVPGLAISVRRLNDTGRHWGWLFISLIPLVGSIILIVYLCQPTTNQQGDQV